MTDDPTNVIRLKVNVNKNIDLDPDKVLQSAIGELDKVIVIGWMKEDDEDGELYVAASSGDAAHSLLLLKLCERMLLSYLDED